MWIGGGCVCWMDVCLGERRDDGGMEVGLRGRGTGSCLGSRGMRDGDGDGDDARAYDGEGQYDRDLRRRA